MTDNKTFEKHLALIQKLYARTSDGKVDWNETNDELTLLTQIGHFILKFRKVPDPDYPDYPDFELSILDEAHKEIERITNAMLHSETDSPTEEGLNPYNLLARTFEIARRQALGVENALENLLQSLTDE